MRKKRCKAVKILFLQVNIWHIIPCVEGFLWSNLIDEAMEPVNDSNCDMTSHKILQYVPYVETYRLPWSPHDYYVRRRFNYRMQWTCCTGYVLSGATCVPRCPRTCEKGTCKEPYVCTCNRGYRMLSDNGEGPCVPECTNGCINGTCVDPEICSCNEGYWLDSDGYTCRPVCDTKCEQNHGYCSEPNVCTCRSGYRKTGNDSSPFTCEPVCERACSNGHCAAPNVCMCEAGYEVDEPFICKPKCDEPCVFGTCTAPGTCTCDHGYKATNASVCEPICSEPCENGTCVAPESCRCNEGYRHRNGSSEYICEPICEIDCGNGKCTAPGLCTCESGFDYNETERRCKPRCTIPCGPNAECISPDQCVCLKGYQVSTALKWLNKSHLNKRTYPFIFSHVTAYTMHVCQPLCDFSCINGECTAPNVCTCDPGTTYYPSWVEFHQSPSNKQRICTKRFGPPCDALSCGENGTCHSSGICVCNDGYAKDTDGDCVPFCIPACANGTCTAPNRCTCHDGFAPRNESLCEPICERGCQNGDCIGPNRCVCHDDFIPNIDHHVGPECIPVCTRNCSGHGVCVIDRGNDYKCECHFGWTGRDCDQPTMCVITMAYDHNDVNRITIRNDTNSTIVRVYESAPYCQCSDKSLDNETLCYMMQSDDDNTTSNISCLFSIDLPCYTTPRYNASINVTKIVWPFVTIAILLAVSLTTAAYLMYRKRQKKKLTTVSVGLSTNIFVRESFATEFLLPDNEILL